MEFEKKEERRKWQYSEGLELELEGGEEYRKREDDEEGSRVAIVVIFSFGA